MGGASLTSSATVDGVPQLFRMSLDGQAAPLVRDYALDPVWSPRGDSVLYSGADVGTTFPVKAVDARGGPHAIRTLTLTRGARRLRFLAGRSTLGPCAGTSSTRTCG